MKKLGWRNELTAHLQKNMRTDFKPGSMDCAIAAADAVKIISGVDHAKLFRKKYKTIRGGLRMLRKMGFKDHVEYAASLFPELPSPLMAQAGDLVIVDDSAFGIVQGENIYVLRPDHGFGIVKLTEAQRAFRI